MADAYSSYVLTHLPFNTDYSWTYVADPAHGFIAPIVGPSLSTAYYKYGNASLYCPGASSGTLQSNSTIYVGTADFTCEFWMYRTASQNSGASHQRIIQIGPNDINGGLWIKSNSSDASVIAPALDIYSGGWNSLLVSSTTYATGVWHHVAACRSGSSWTLWVDGALAASATLASYEMVSNTVYIGGNVPQNQNYYTGYLDDLRITVGVARYTAAFTPPAAIEYTARTLVTSKLAPYSVLSAFTPATKPVTSKIGAWTGSYDIYFGGDGYLTGTTKVKVSSSYTVVSRRVRLHEKLSGIIVGETWSDSSGAWTVKNLNRAYTYYAVAFDHTKNYESVVGDNLAPVKMS